jgi:four helix bundle protein
LLFLICVYEARIKDLKLRDQAERAAQSVCLNISEGAGRSGLADKARMYAIARGELSEAASALEVALVTRGCLEGAARRGAGHANAAYALLTGLIRRAG